MSDLDNNDDDLAFDKTSMHPVNRATSYRLRSHDEIAPLLNKLWKNHSPLSISLSEESRTYGSMVLEINERKQYLVLDKLFPGFGPGTSLLNTKLSVQTQLDGIEIDFKVVVEEVAEREGIEYYKVSYPSIVFHHQRRSSFRVNCGISNSIRVAISTEDDVLLHAELRDISLDGLSVRISSPFASALKVGDEIPSCIIHTPEGEKIVSSMEVARVQPGNSAQAVRIGVNFIHMSTADRHLLSRLIAKQDRENIKKIKRLSETN